MRDHIDFEAGQAWLECELDGRRLRFDAVVEDDWVDPSAWRWFARLLNARDTGRRFTYLDLGGQDFLLGCATAQQRKGLRKETGLMFEWLR